MEQQHFEAAQDEQKMRCQHDKHIQHEIQGVSSCYVCEGCKELTRLQVGSTPRKDGTYRVYFVLYRGR